MWRLMILPLTCLCRMLLFCMGWSLLDDKTVSNLFKEEFSVAVFSHTSYVDFFILILYLFAQPELLGNINVIVKPQPFRNFSWILRFFGAIPATKVDEKNGGGVTRIIKELENNKGKILLISPKGTIVKREWRTGYYYLAKKLKAPLKAVGLDYEHKKIFISKSIDCELSEPTIKLFLYEQLSQIVPLFPEEEIMIIRQHDSDRRGVVSKNCVVNVILLSNIIFVCMLGGRPVILILIISIGIILGKHNCNNDYK